MLSRNDKSTPDGNTWLVCQILGPLGQLQLYMLNYANHPYGTNSHCVDSGLNGDVSSNRGFVEPGWF